MELNPNPYEAPQVPDKLQSPPLREERDDRLDYILPVLQPVIGCVLGYLVWVPTAPLEAWDVNPLYSTLVFAAGFLSPFFRQKTWYCGPLGVYVGQVAALHRLVPPVGIPIAPPIFGVLIGGTAPAVAGGLAGYGIGWAIGNWLAKRRAARTL